MNRMITLVIFVIGVLVSISAQADIYKWKDTNGVVRYSDTPPNGNIPTESIKSRKIINPESTALTKDTSDSKEAAAMKRQETAEAEKKSSDELKAKEEEKKNKKQNCLLAKDSLKNYQDGALVYKVNDKGEREYLDEAGMAKGMAEAQKNVKQYCQ
ncbi:MAG TPA: DUF4124 domain-containing protein [Methyloradius sp.]